MMAAAKSSDWYPGVVPPNIQRHPSAYIGSSYSFRRFRSERSPGLSLASHATLDDGATLDIGPEGAVHIGAYAIVASAMIICDCELIIEDYAMVAWNAVLIDTYRRQRTDHVSGREVESAPIRIGRGAWIGFGACILPGVIIGAGTIVGARSVVHHSLPPNVLAAGNPVRIIRHLL